MIKVSKYYVKKLVVDRQGEPPKLACEIEKPKEIFEEIKIELMNSINKDRNKYLVKAMMLVYKQYFKHLGPIKLYPYLLVLFSKDHFEECQFLLTQFLYITFTVEDQNISKKNINKFIKLDGLDVLKQ